MAFVVEPSQVQLMANTSAGDLALTITITIVGETVEVERDKVFCSQAIVSP
jgi:hypothetical protein